MKGFYKHWETCTLGSGVTGYILKNNSDADIILIPVYDTAQKQIISVKMEVLANKRTTCLYGTSYPPPARTNNPNKPLTNDEILKATSQMALMDASTYFQTIANKYAKLSDHYYEKYGAATTDYRAIDY